MKMLHAAQTAIARALGPREAEVEKRDGVYVARYLEPRNAKRWHDWAVRHGIPNPVPPEEMHVTLVYSEVDVKLARDERAINIRTEPGYGDAGAFCMFGPENDVLVYTFDEWGLYNRFHEFCRHGAVSKWPCYRPHLSLSMDAAGFELSDDALSDVPPFIVLLGEVNADIKKKVDKGNDAQDGCDECEDGDEVLIIVVELAQKAAKALLEEHKAEKKFSVMDAYALADVERGRLSRGVAKRLAQTDWAPAEIKDLAKAEAAPPPQKAAPVRRSREVVVTVSPFTGEASKSAGLPTKSITRISDHRRIVRGIASVSTVDGEMITDSHGAKITTECLEEFCWDLVRNQRGGKFDHEGDVCNEVVAAYVLSDDIAKNAGITAGYEPFLIDMHVPRDEDWKMVLDGDWMFSIAGTLYYVMEGETDA